MAGITELLHIWADHLQDVKKGAPIPMVSVEDANMLQPAIDALRQTANEISAEQIQRNVGPPPGNWVRSQVLKPTNGR